MSCHYKAIFNFHFLRNYLELILIIQLNFLNFFLEKGKKLQVNVGEKLFLWPNNKTTGHVVRCEAAHVGEYENTIYEIQPKSDTRLSYDYNGNYTNCNFTLTSFEDKFYGEWIVSSYYTYPEGSENRFREDVIFQIDRKQ